MSIVSSPASPSMVIVFEAKARAREVADDVEGIAAGDASRP